MTLAVFRIIKMSEKAERVTISVVSLAEVTEAEEVAGADLVYYNRRCRCGAGVLLAVV